MTNAVKWAALAGGLAAAGGALLWAALARVDRRGPARARRRAT